MSIPTDRQCRLLRKVRQGEQLDQQETAEFCGTTRSVVAMTERRALDKIRDALGGDDAVRDLFGGAA